MNRSKYGNVKVEIDGYKFDSKREARRYQELKLLEKAKQITKLEVHPEWVIGVKGTDVCKYVADFSYFDVGNVFRVEDVKGYSTPLFRLKKKLMLAAYGIYVVEI